MEKVKLPKEICEALDKLFENNNDLGEKTKYYVLWYCLQSPSFDCIEECYRFLNEFSNEVDNTEKMVNAILYGYDPEETEEERKEREIKDKMIEYIKKNSRSHNIYNDYVNELYDIAHGKK